MKSYTDLEQSKKLAEILPFESADMWWNGFVDEEHFIIWNGYPNFLSSDICTPCWSLTALLSVLPEINDIHLTLEKVKAENGYVGYYYHVEYKYLVLTFYSKNPIDACVEMILKLNKLNLL